MQPFENLVELYQWSCEKHADQPMLGTKKHGAWTYVTYRQFKALVDAVRGGLAGLGIKPGDRVAFIGDNSVEWAAAAYASYGLGAAFVPMYLAQRPGEWQFILADCKARAVFIGTEAGYDALSGMRQMLPELGHVIGLSRPDSASDSWKGLVAAGVARPVAAISPESKSVAGFIYTSGTTGKPKGALLSHGNIMSNIIATHQLFELSSDERYLSFLPWAHSFGQTVELHMLVSYGASLAFNDELPKLLDNLAEVKPTVLVAVPRIFNRIYDAVNREIATRPGFVQRIINGGVRGAIKRTRGEPIGAIERLELAFDDKLVFNKIRERFGGRLRYVFSGSATLSRDVAEFIDALGIKVYEGYGLTETSPIVTSNSPRARRFGSVGQVIPGVRVVIDTKVTGHEREGEIVVYGPNVMLGYHNRPEEEVGTLMADGGLRTGDLGYLDADGFLYISGRIKEQYKLQNGKYVMPSPLEERLKLSPYIANVMLYGDGREFNVALIVTDPQALGAWAAREAVTLGADVTADPRVRALIGDEIERLVADFKGFEKPRDFAILGQDFTADAGFLTPTLKLKRREVVARYGKVIEALYQRRAAVH